jgi:hypothetical protein
MDPIFVAPGRELHAHQRVEGDQSEIPGVLAFLDAGIGLWLIRTRSLGREDDVNGIAYLAFSPIKKYFDALRFSERSNVAMNKPGGGQRCGCRGQVFAAEQQVDVTGVAHRGFIRSRDPGGHGISTDDSIRNSRGIERRRCPQESASNIFHGVFHTLPGNWQ